MTIIRYILAGCVAGTMLTGTASAQRLVPKAAIPNASPTVQQTQSGDDVFRVNQLEEEVRRLNGRVEELNFLLLQMQEKLRKMEEENELRFQELEESSSGGNRSRDVAGTEANRNRLEKPESSAGRNTAADSTNDGVSNGTESPNVAQSESGNRKGALPRALGTLTFDSQGNVIDSNPAGKPGLQAPEGAFDDASEGVEAAEFGATPGEVITAGKAALNSRLYPRGEVIFSAFIKAWPKDPRLGEARYHLAESMFWQKKYYQAADIHLDTHRDFPRAKTAPENLLGLGLALAGLNQREVACATYAEVLQQYPDAAPRLGERIKDEQASARC